MTKKQKLILLIDTAGDEAGVALMYKKEKLADRRWKSDPSAGRLLEEIDSLLKGVGKKIENVKKIAICEGPGRRYSALRAGVVTGTMLVYAENADLASYEKKNSEVLFKNIKIRSRSVVIPKYQKTL
jgi:tRNA A37 threonylcarbamoyladenosine modification protein TsaB